MQSGVVAAAVCCLLRDAASLCTRKAMLRTRGKTADDSQQQAAMQYSGVFGAGHGMVWPVLVGGWRCM